MNAINNWLEYAQMRQEESMLAYYKHNNLCPSCNGSGDHGYDEEGLPYICYGCGGTGNYTGNWV
jgi:DnaJ-class molecular chaperone